MAQLPVQPWLPDRLLHISQEMTNEPQTSELVASFLGQIRQWEPKVRSQHRVDMEVLDYKSFHYQHARANRNERRRLEREARKRGWL